MSALNRVGQSLVVQTRLSRRRMLQLGAAGIGTAALSPLLAACGDDEDPTATSGTSGSAATPTGAPSAAATPTTEAPAEGEPTSGGELVAGIKSSYIDVLDPNITAQTVAHLIMMPMFDTFVYQDKEKEFWPGLASAWETNAEGTEHTFTLQSGVKFHDGTDFNAEAVVFNLERMISADSKSRLAGPRLSGFYESSEAIDPTTVKVVFSQPNGAFMTDLSQNFMTMLSPAAVEKYSAEEIGRNPVGTGPFTFVEWVENSHIKMVRNEDYNWASPMFGRQGPAYLDAITFRIIPEDGSRIAALESGELNYVDIVPTIDFTRIQADSSYTTYSVPQPGVPYAFMLNTKRAPTDDIAVRKAINFAVDKQAIIDTLYQGLYTPAYGPLSPASFAYNAAVETMYPWDPEQAKQLLEEAGWVEGSNGIRAKDGVTLEIEHYVFTDTKVAEVMQAQLKEVGIQSNVTLLEVGAVNEAATRGEENNLAPLPYRDADPAVLCVVLCIKNEGKGFAWTFHKNEELDNELEAGQAAVDPAEREQHYGRAQEIAMEEALLIPVYNNNGLAASTAKVKGVTFDEKGVDPWVYNMWIEQ